jgi:formylmethanofuran dehydrogenase subunit A
MPTILFVLGWRFFFYSNENKEPIHIHCQKSGKECKYWLDVENFDIYEAFSFNMNIKDKREVKKIIFEYFDHIENEWNKFQKGKKK